MNKIIIAAICLFVGTSLYSQKLTPEMFGFESYSIQTGEYSDVSYYLTADSTGIKKPLLVYLDGSGANPLFQKFDDGYGSTVVFDYQTLQDDYRILLISKPGVPFIDNVDSDDNGFPFYKEPIEYKEKLSFHWRLESADIIIKKLIKENIIDTSKVVVFGGSEGAQVAPSLAKINPYITHLILFGGNGLNQLIDPIAKARMKATRGEISEIDAQNEVDSLFLEYEKIYNDPKNTDKDWWGHTYKRWSSFTERDPYKELLELDIPVYMANGSLDDNTVLSADYIKLEFIKHKKNNLTYKTYPNYDHQFNEIIIENGQFIEAKPMLDLVLKNTFRWLDEN